MYFLLFFYIKVAPHAGAWIETYAPQPERGIFLSPLMQGRGLKLAVEQACRPPQGSPLMQGRGLKLDITVRIYDYLASPLMQGRGLKQLIDLAYDKRLQSPLMQGRGLKLER